jgi:hypothetical protein
VRTDVATHGNWKGVYGSEGYAIFGDSTSYPAYAQVTATGKADSPWASNPMPTTARSNARRTAASPPAGNGASFNVDVNLTDQATHRVAMYSAGLGQQHPGRPRRRASMPPPSKSSPRRPSRRITTACIWCGT